jgi:hypothetical protein
MQQKNKIFSNRKANRLAVMPVIAGGFAIVAGLIWSRFLPGATFCLGVAVTITLWETFYRRDKTRRGT